MPQEGPRHLDDYLHPLCQAVISGNQTVEEFWQKVATLATPIIEPDPGNPEYSIVTFLWRDDGSANHVSLHLGFGQPAHNKLEPIDGTDILTRSYRLENDVRLRYRFVKDLPLVDLDGDDQKAVRALRTFLETAELMPDPFNPQQFVFRDEEDEEDVSSLLILKDALNDDYAAKREGIERGWIQSHEFKSDILENERTIWVYTPPGFEDSSGEYPVLLMFDGGAYLSMVPTHRILDNLITDEKIPPLLGVFINNATPDSRNVELPCSESFADFIAAELYPWLAHHYPISPAAPDWYAAGSNFGGLAATWLGFQLPQQIGNVISQSGSFWWGPGYDFNTSATTAEYERMWLIDQFENSATRPTRLWLEIGKLEHAETMLATNRKMAEVMKAKGYDVVYHELGGGHDYAHWRTSLPLALQHLMGPKG